MIEDGFFFVASRLKRDFLHVEDHLPVPIRGIRGDWNSGGIGDDASSNTVTPVFRRDVGKLLDEELEYGRRRTVQFRQIDP